MKEVDSICLEKSMIMPLNLAESISNYANKKRNWCYWNFKEIYKGIPKGFYNIKLNHGNQMNSTQNL